MELVKSPGFAVVVWLCCHEVLCNKSQIRVSSLALEVSFERRKGSTCLCLNWLPLNVFVTHQHSARRHRNATFRYCWFAFAFRAREGNVTSPRRVMRARHRRSPGVRWRCVWRHYVGTVRRDLEMPSMLTSRTSVKGMHWILFRPVAYLGILLGGWGGVNKFSWGQRTERTGIWGR